jgi:hypothetical protein
VDSVDDVSGVPDDERTVDFEAEDVPVLPDQTRDDTDQGWGDREGSNDDRLLEDKPPHWA